MSYSIFTLAGNTGTLGFDVTNTNGSSQIFVTSSVSLNVLTITVTNNDEKTVTIPLGTPLIPPPVDPPNDGHGYLYIMFNGALLDVLDFTNQKLVSGDSNEWNIEFVLNDNQYGSYYALSPVNNISLATGEYFILTLTGLTCSATQSPGQISLMYDDVTPIKSDTTVCPMQVVQPPPTGPVAMQLDASFAGSYIIPVGSGAPSSSLMLVLANPAGTPLVSGYSAWNGVEPVFTVSFIFNDTDGGLTSDGTGITVTLVDDFGNGWPQPVENPGGGSPFWQFTLQLNDGSASGYVIGAESSVTILIQGIQSDAAIGVTPCIISWSNVAGYYDGQTTVSIVKVEPVTASISVNNNPIDMTNPPASPTQLTIEVSNADTAMVTNTGYFQRIVSGYLNDTISINPNINTTYTVVATNFSTAQQTTDSVIVAVTPDMYALFPKQTVIMWSGYIDTIPKGWVLCNGVALGDGTPVPDLTDRFVIGAGGTVASDSNQTGGTFSHSHNVPIPEGTIMNSNSPQDGAHGHSTTFQTTMMVSSGHTSHYMVMFGNTNYNSKGATTSYADGTSNANKSVDTDTSNNAGAHYHNLPSATTNVTSDTTSTQQPWYSLAFIMKSF